MSDYSKQFLDKSEMKVFFKLFDKQFLHIFPQHSLFFNIY